LIAVPEIEEELAKSGDSTKKGFSKPGVSYSKRILLIFQWSIFWAEEV